MHTHTCTCSSMKQLQKRKMHKMFLLFLIISFWTPQSSQLLSFSSVQFSRSVVSDSLRPHESQHARPPCPSPSPGVYSDSHPSSPWCHPAISSWVVPFSEVERFKIVQVLTTLLCRSNEISSNFPLQHFHNGSDFIFILLRYFWVSLTWDLLSKKISSLHNSF